MKKYLLVCFLVFLFSINTNGQEYISFFPWTAGNLTGSLQSDPNVTQTTKTGCIYADVTVVLSGGAWQTSNPQFNSANGLPAANIGLNLGVNWSSTSQTVTVTIDLKNNSGILTEYPVEFDVYDLNSAPCATPSGTEFIDSVRVIGLKSNLSTTVNPTVTNGGCTGNTTNGNSVKGGSSCGATKGGTWTFNSSNTIARIVITYRSGTRFPSNLASCASPWPLVSGGNPGNQHIVISPLRITAAGASAPTGITGTTSICGGGSTTLTATGGNSSTKWYTGSCGGTQIGTGSTLTVSPSSNTTYFAANQGLCNITACASTTVNVTNRTVSAASISPTVCINNAITNITHTTTGVTAINSSTGLPPGVSASYASNTITISGTSTQSGTYNYTITPNGCGSATATGTITVNAPSPSGLSGNDYLWLGNSVTGLSDIFVDSESDPNCTLVGFGSGSSTGGWYGGTARYNSGTTGAATATATYTPNVITSGTYEVFFSIVRGSNRAADVPFSIIHAGGTTNLSINQQGSGFEWKSLGTFNFNAGTSGKIIISNGPMSDASKLAMADAIKLVYIPTTNNYETPNNWILWNSGTSKFETVTSAPNLTNNVNIKPTGSCVNNQPNVTTTNAQANNLTIFTGGSLTSLNATTLTVAGNWSSTGQYNENQGKIVFTGSGKTITTNVFEGETFYNVDFNNGSSISMNSDVNVLNALGLAGTVTTGSKVFWLKNSAGDATSLPDFSGKIVGTFKRDIANNTSTYSFPVARTTDGTRYLAQIINSNMNGVSFINGSVRALTESGNNVDSRIVARQGDLLTNVIEGSIWSLVPNTQPTSGSYGVRLYNTSGLPDDKFCPVKRPGGSSDYNQWDTFQGTTLIPNAGSAGRTASSGYAERLGYTSFSEHAIATTPGTLPVKLSFFKANCTNKTQAEIKWQTLTERNSERFEIEKSLDGDIFNVIANIPAAGNSNNPINYAYIDNLNLNETTYYRLNQYDLDGTKNILEVKSINCENNTLDLDVVFPVPVVENLNATISSSYNRLVKLEIYNAIGQVVYFNSLNIETGNNRVTLNNFEIANGAYLLKISDNADNSLFVAKQFVINK
jgi:hypothetical protein